MKGDEWVKEDGGGVSEKGCVQGCEECVIRYIFLPDCVREISVFSRSSRAVTAATDRRRSCSVLMVVY